MDALFRQIVAFSIREVDAFHVTPTLCLVLRQIKNKVATDKVTCFSGRFMYNHSKLLTTSIFVE